MCIIAAKNKGVAMPTMDTIETMWRNNSDGAGLMWVVNSRVYIEKGFMTLSDLKNKIKELESVHDLTKVPVVMHFRITTHGGTSAQNCHPFPISESVSVLQKIKFYSTLGVAHNGVIPITPRKNISDTMEYIASQMSYLQRIKRDFYKDPNCQELIYNAINSKMCFLDFKGEIHTIGKFEEKDGILYSNNSYTPRIYYGKTDYWDDYKNISRYSKYGIYTDVADLMWVDESKGYVKTKNGQLDDGMMYLMDKNSVVYAYDPDSDCCYSMDGYTAYNEFGSPLKYEEDLAITFEIDPEIIEDDCEEDEEEIKKYNMDLDEYYARRYGLDYPFMYSDTVVHKLPEKVKTDIKTAKKEGEVEEKDKK